MRFPILLIVTALSLCAAAQQIPVGTAIPVMLRSDLNSAKVKAGEQVEGRVMQEVPLPGGDKISKRARITGHVVSVTKKGSSGSTIVVKFEAIEDNKQSTPLSVAVLALASMSAVADAQSPIGPAPDRDPVTQWRTRQVGGDVVDRGRGKVVSKGGVEGKWVEGSSIISNLTPNPRAGCPEGPGYDHEQAVWIFSSAACGVYGMNDTKIVSNGAMPPLGKIELRARGNVNVRGGSGWLLMTVGELEQ
jgi:hypothetical protein